MLHESGWVVFLWWSLLSSNSREARIVTLRSKNKDNKKRGKLFSFPPFLQTACATKPFRALSP